MINFRCLLFGHDWKFRTYTAEDLAKKVREFIGSSSAICRRCGKEEIWIDPSYNYSISVDPASGAIVVSHQEGDLTIIDSVDYGDKKKESPP